LIARIERIVSVKDRIHVYREDTKDLLCSANMKKIFQNCLLYLDPPYYKKGRQLYKNFYKHKDHEEISTIMRHLEGKWIVSYDNQPEIQKLYENFEYREFNLTYFAGFQTGKRERNGKEIMFFSNAIKTIPNLSLIP